MKVVNQYQNDALSILAQLANISLIITERVNGSLSGWDGLNTDNTGAEHSFADNSAIDQHGMGAQRRRFHL